MLALEQRPAEAREEWLRTPPPEWERRLREISPIVDKTSHLRFRWRGDDEQWNLYECSPIGILSPSRIEQLSVHWSTLPKAQQQGRKTFVTEYQFWMFQTFRVDAGRFWILQGTEVLQGGTPFAFTERERKILEASHEEVEPIPPGILPNIPFDERVVKAILARDRLLKAGGDLDLLEKEQRPDHLKREDEQLEQDFRKAFLDWHHANNAPNAEFMAWYTRKKESEQTLPRAPRNLANRLSEWRDRYIETGHMVGVTPNTIGN